MTWADTGLDMAPYVDIEGSGQGVLFCGAGFNPINPDATICLDIEGRIMQRSDT